MGLWSVSISAFAGPGASFTFGQNPNGSGLASLQFGSGLGGGVKYAPFGQQQEYSPSQGTAWGLGLGLYAQGDFNAGYNNAGALTNVEWNFTACGSDPYATPRGVPDSEARFPEYMRVRTLVARSRYSEAESSRGESFGRGSAQKTGSWN
jgi:hypothetical protein